MQQWETNTSEINALPEDNSVEGQVIIVEEGELGQDAENIFDSCKRIKCITYSSNSWSSQGGASGVNNPDKDQINEGHITAPLLSNSKTENKQLCPSFIDRFSQNSNASSPNMNSPLDWLEQGKNLNNYNTMFIKSLAFLTLFLFASSNATYRDHIYK
eukprot:6202384-Ditylum_brightwellii.AAC.1